MAQSLALNPLSFKMFGRPNDTVDDPTCAKYASELGHWDITAQLLRAPPQTPVFRRMDFAFAPEPIMLGFHPSHGHGSVLGPRTRVVRKLDWTMVVRSIPGRRR